MTTEKEVAFYGLTGNPPGNHHVTISERLGAVVPEVVVIPTGPRGDDKPTADDVEPIHRAAMCTLAFRNVPNVTVELSDLERSAFTRNHEWEQIFRARGYTKVWHVVGADKIEGGRDGRSDIHLKWQNAEWVWNNLLFIVLTRPGHPINVADLPPNCKLLELRIEGSSTAIRNKAFNHEPFDHLVPPAVAAYMKRHNLYRGTSSLHRSIFQTDDPKPFFLVDPDNPRTDANSPQGLAERIIPATPRVDDIALANMLIVLGGDGYQLKVSREYWQWRLPLVGMNGGNVGFLMNSVGDEWDPSILCQPMTSFLQYLLYVEFEDGDGQIHEFYGANDAWVTSPHGEQARIKAVVNGKERIKNLPGEGAHFATPMGSSARCRSMGGPVLPLDTRALVMLADHPSPECAWKMALLPFGSDVEITNNEPERRVLWGIVDGPKNAMQKIVCMRLRYSLIAAYELCFLPGNDFEERRLDAQFPKFC